jgi:broad specificity phosphatase PhoE
MQAEEAGRRLRSMLKPDDTIQFFTSPYRRTRETTEGILKTLTSDDPVQGPSPFPRHKITVYEEPRLREQDFGNFQPCSAEMERMWQERADYGHFFYRIQNGESAADAYDRVSGFNESLWRQFGDPDFPSVCVLVTHGLMTRIFLMKWYHWSVEYFEDLRNVNHCEFIIMKQNRDKAESGYGKYTLENELRTWSDLKRRAALNEQSKSKEPPTPKPIRKWGGCVDGCDHGKIRLPPRPRRQNTLDYGAAPLQGRSSNESEDHPTALPEMEQGNPPLRRKTMSSKSLLGSSTSLSTHQEAKEPPEHKEGDAVPLTPSSSSAANDETDAVDIDGPESDGEEHPEDSSPLSGSPTHTHRTVAHHRLHRSRQPAPHGGRGAFGFASADISDEADESDYFDTNIYQMEKRMSRSEASRSALSQIEDAPSGNQGPTGSISRTGSKSKLARNNSASRLKEKEAKEKEAKEMEKQWQMDSGMTQHKRADALGDMDEDEDVTEIEEIEAMKDKDRKGFSEVY